MSAAQDIADGLAEVEQDIPETFTWNGAAYVCTSGSADSNLMLGIGGHVLEATLLVNIRLALFKGGATPQPQQTGVYSEDGRTYRIESVHQPPGSPFLQFALRDPNRGI